MQKHHQKQALPDHWCSIAPTRPLSTFRAVSTIKVGSVAMILAMALACSAGVSSDETLGARNNIPTPDREQVQIIDRDLPAGLTDPAASAA